MSIKEEKLVKLTRKGVRRREGGRKGNERGGDKRKEKKKRKRKERTGEKWEKETGFAFCDSKHLKPILQGLCDVTFLCIDFIF